MGFLNFFSKPAPRLLRLSAGSFTLDRDGNILVTTLPSSFPADLLQLIGRNVLQTFRDAQSVQLPLTELIVRYGSLKITAREMRGGAIVFLAPQTPISTATQPRQDL